jgi:hypothetical protein
MLGGEGGQIRDINQRDIDFNEEELDRPDISQPQNGIYMCWIEPFFFSEGAIGRFRAARNRYF